MDSNLLVTGLLWFIAFLFSTTCHEAAHAWAGLRGGDKTAYSGGQVSLNPWPHIQREPVGMVVIPWVSFYLGGWMMGWASAPYDPYWARRYPRRSAWMSLAGPAANFAIVLLTGIAINLGVAAGVFRLSGRLEFDQLVAATSTGPMEGLAALLSVLFSLNLLLGAFNLMPFPPLDGFSVLGIFLPESATLKLMDFRDSLGGMSMLGVLIAWRAFDYIFEPVFITGLRLLYLPHL
ncbi:MAG: site-2 protease family protein [Acidobacteriota bacterium]